MTDINLALLDTFLREHSEKESSHYQDIVMDIKEMNLSLEMLSSHSQGVLLKIISAMINPKVVVEVGTFVGFTAACFAQGISGDGKVFTFEKNETLKEVIQKNLARAGVQERVEIIFGDARETLTAFHQMIDLSFIDADKGSYKEYYEMLLEKTRPGGFILVDNVIWKYKTLCPESYPEDTLLKSMIAFNTHIKNDTRVEKVMIPIRDGLYVIQKK